MSEYLIPCCRVEYPNNDILYIFFSEFEREKIKDYRNLIKFRQTNFFYLVMHYINL